MTGDIWPHQRDGIEFARVRPGTMFHVPMGLGKTRMAIEVAAQMEARSILVLCPRMVCRAWLRQLQTFATGQYSALVLGPEPTLMARGEDPGPLRKSRTAAQRVQEIEHYRPDILVLNYDAARQPALAKALLGREWDLVVCDEIHRCKAPFGKTSKMIAKLKARKRLGLTGTVMPHSPLDVWAQYRFIEPSIFGWSFVGFRSRYAVMGGFQKRQVTGWKNMDDLREKMARVTFSVEDNSALLGVPDFTDEFIAVDLGKEARRAYTELAAGLEAKIDGGYVSAANALTKLIRLQQITSGVVKLDDDRSRRVDTAKVEALEEIIEDAGSEPVVVFGRWRADMDSTRAACIALEEPYSELSGEENDLAAWEAEPRRRVLAVQIQSGGVGIDLTKSRICVFLSTGWNLGDYLQARKRLHRPGQTRHVVYYHVLARDTVDDSIRRAIRRREDFVESTIKDLRRIYA